jgi:hypothetical protein
MATSTAATPSTLTRVPTQPKTRKPAKVVLGISAAALAVAGGIALGQRLTAGPSVIAPAPGAAVSFPSDWQVYRAGERGDVAPANLPGDWTSYRSGEH